MLARRAVVALAVVLLSLAGPLAAQEPVFRDLTLESLRSLPPRGEAGEVVLPARFRVLEVDVAALESVLDRAPVERSAEAAAAPVVLALPYPDGSDRLFRIEESPVLEPGLAARFPELRTFVAWGIDDPTATARLSLTPLGFHAMVLSVSGTLYVDPYRRRDPGYVLSYWKRDARKAAGPAFDCGVRDESPGRGGAPGAGRVPEPEVIAATTGTLLRTYRLALAGTGEYTAAVCAPGPPAVPCGLAAMVVSMNRVNGIYEREVAIRMVLVANNDLLVYTDGATDPYSNGNGSTMLGQNQSNLNGVIGLANYDIGHVFSTGGGGVANLGVPCTSSKARGVTGQPLPLGDPFDVDYVAHEMGHQFGAAHTYNGTTDRCGGNRSGTSAFEPGSGTTIMAYAGICGDENLQPHSDDTFHTRSFDQIVAFSAGGTGNSCAVRTLTGNTAPVVKVGPAATIPRRTPFTLTGSARDTEGDALTYMWEEFDLGSAAPPNTDASAVRPIFRSFVPRSVPSRTFPRLEDVLGNAETLGESMPSRDRTMTFRLTVRDGRGGVNHAATTVRVVAAAGPFRVTQPDTAVTWPGGSAQTVSWDVAGTTASPVSCGEVAIALSIDGGATFEDLVAATPNDGAESVLLPLKPTGRARIRVACVGNVFFDISNADFTIT